MTRDEAMMLLWPSIEKWHGGLDETTKSALTGRNICELHEAAATVIQQAFAEREEAIRQAGVQEGLDMAAVWLGKEAEAIDRLNGAFSPKGVRSIAAAIRKLGGDDETD